MRGAKYSHGLAWRKIKPEFEMLTNIEANLFMPLSPPFESEPGKHAIIHLPYWDIHIGASQTVRELLALLDQSPQAAGVLVLEKNQLLGLLPRELVYEKLGRPYGVELFLKVTCRHFYKVLGVTTLVLEADTPIEDAIAQALLREGNLLYGPMVIAHVDGYRTISMHSLLAAQQNKLQDLHSELHHLSTKDPLTGINNRRGFFDALNTQLASIHQLDLDFAILMIDIDNFKSVNDRYGHLVGDEVLKAVARQLQLLARDNDILGRFGGEEFVTFMVDVLPDAAFEKAEALRQGVAGCFHHINGFEIRVTLSIGIGHSSRANGNLDRVLAQADQAVYAAKHSGRNTVMRWQENFDQPQYEPRSVRASFPKTAPDDIPGQLLEQTLQGLLHMLYLRDFETEAHTQRVMELTLKLAQKVGMGINEYENIRIGCLLHDIGKIAIPDKILFKKGKLTETEWEIMKKHPEHAYELLAPISYFQQALDIPHCHHEHWDGNGYPRGLQGEEIPLTARIFTIVDVWDALTSDRPYSVAWKKQDAKEYIQSQSGILFDPTLLPLFFEILPG